MNYELDDVGVWCDINNNFDLLLGVVVKITSEFVVMKLADDRFAKVYDPAYVNVSKKTGKIFRMLYL